MNRNRNTKTKTKTRPKTKIKEDSDCWKNVMSYRNITNLCNLYRVTRMKPIIYKGISKVGIVIYLQITN